MSDLSQKLVKFRIIRRIEVTGYASLAPHACSTLALQFLEHENSDLLNITETRSLPCELIEVLSESVLESVEISDCE